MNDTALSHLCIWKNDDIKILSEHRSYGKHKKMVNFFLCYTKKIYANKTIINFKSNVSYATIKIFCFLYFLCAYIKVWTKIYKLCVCLMTVSLNEIVVLRALNVCFLWKGCGEELNSMNVVSVSFIFFIFSPNSSCRFTNASSKSIQCFSSWCSRFLALTPWRLYHLTSLIMLAVLIFQIINDLVLWRIKGKAVCR